MLGVVEEQVSEDQDVEFSVLLRGRRWEVREERGGVGAPAEAFGDYEGVSRGGESLDVLLEVGDEVGVRVVCYDGGGGAEDGGDEAGEAGAGA